MGTSAEHVQMSGMQESGDSDPRRASASTSQQQTNVAAGLGAANSPAAHVAAANLLASGGLAGGIPFSPFRTASSLSATGATGGLFPAQVSYSVTGGVAPTPVASLGPATCVNTFATLGGHVTTAGSVIRPAAAAPALPALNYSRPIIRQYTNQADSVNVLLSGVGGAFQNAANLTAENSAADRETQKLKVEDALSYLDQVKVQFANKPQVYSDFLDIMKDFKSQAIDTPGVIQRVSTLFRGRPNLIVGFNTFLPPGFRIEVNGDRISICTPNGEHRVISEGGNAVELTGATVPNTNNNNNTNATGLTNQQQAAAPTVQSAAATLFNQSANQLAGLSAAAVPPKPLGGNDYVLNTNAQPTQMHRQAIEFNHAISYVNKIKNRFQNNPEVYKQFLEILHSYQKEQRDLKSNLAAKPTLSESEVYQSVARLFATEPDLLREFSQFLPDATSNVPSSFLGALQHPSIGGNTAQNDMAAAQNAMQQNASTSLADTHASVNGSQSPMRLAQSGSSQALNSALTHIKDEPHVSSSPQPIIPPGGDLSTRSQEAPRVIKRPGSPMPTGGKRTTKESSKQPRRSGGGAVELSYDVPMSDAAKFGTMVEYEFFDKVRRVACNNDRLVYDNFLRCLALYNQDLISKMELVELVQPFLSLVDGFFRRRADLMQWLKEFMGCDERNGYSDIITHKNVEERAAAQHINSDLALQIDYTTCKQHGVSYRALPASYQQPVCSGRTELCKEVLNDIWVSFPSWSEGDTGCVSSKKTTYEEFIYRTEDERFELDIVIETNYSAILVLEALQKRPKKLTPEEMEKLGDSFGGRMPAPIFERALRRIYGEKAADIIVGLKRNPAVAVPLVLKRLKSKDLEWREAQKNFNQIWREQNDKYYLKSLDHQGQTSKQNDQKQLKSKALLNQIETLYDERRERLEQTTDDAESINGPHLQFKYANDKQLIYDVADLLIHHVRRQTGIQKEEKSKIKRIIRQMLPDFFGLDREQLSDDDDEPSSSTDDRTDQSDKEEAIRKWKRSAAVEKKETKKEKTEKPNNNTSRPPSGAAKSTYNNRYSLLFGTNAWYVFLRLHQILCDRLHQLKRYAHQQQQPTGLYSPTQDNNNTVMFNNLNDKESNNKRTNVPASEALKCARKSSVAPEKCYAHLLQSIKNLLDGQIDAAQFEDELREMFTIKAFLAFTMDRFIPTMVKQLQTIVSDDLNVSIVAAYDKFMRTVDNGAEPYNTVLRAEAESDYQQCAETLMTDQNCFKIYMLHDTSEITFELLDTDSPEDDEDDDGDEDDVKLSCYMKYYEHLWDSNKEQDEEQSKTIAQTLKQTPRFLVRNINRVRSYHTDAQRPSTSSRASNQSTPDKGKGRKSAASDKTDNIKTESPTTTSSDQPPQSDAQPSTSGDAGCKSEPGTAAVDDKTLISDDSLQITVDAKTGANLGFVRNTGFMMRRPRAPGKAKDKHATVTSRRHSRFDRWHTRRWTELCSTADDEGGGGVGTASELHQTHEKWMKAVGQEHIRTRVVQWTMQGFEYLTARRYTTETKRPSSGTSNRSETSSER